MKTTSQGEVSPNSQTGTTDEPPARPWDWPSAVMIALAVAVSAWSFWPRQSGPGVPDAAVAAGQRAPGLWCVDSATAEPLLGLVPRGWFVWLVLAPADGAQKSRLDDELKLVRQAWSGMADLDRWRGVVVAADQEQGRALADQLRAVAETPLDVGLATGRTWDTWGHAGRVRHVLVEPSGRILMIEPAELDQPGVVKKISDEIRRRLRQWEGNFDDQPRFS